MTFNFFVYNFKYTDPKLYASIISGCLTKEFDPTLFWKLIIVSTTIIFILDLNA